MAHPKAIIEIPAYTGRLDLDLAQYNNHMVVFQGEVLRSFILNITNSNPESVVRDTPIDIEIYYNVPMDSWSMFLDSHTYHSGPNLQFAGIQGTQIHDWMSYTGEARMPCMYPQDRITVRSFVDPAVSRPGLVVLGYVSDDWFYDEGIEA